MQLPLLQMVVWGANNLTVTTGRSVYNPAIQANPGRVKRHLMQIFLLDDALHFILSNKNQHKYKKHCPQL